MNNDKDSSFRRYKFKSDFVNAGLMFATATLTAAGGFVFQKTTGLPLDSISPTLKSLFPLAVGAGVATLTTLNNEPEVGDRYYRGSVSSENKDILERIFNKTGYDKSVEIHQFNDSNSDFIAQAVYGGKIYINEAKFNLLDENGKKRVLGNGVSRLINKDGVSQNANHWIGVAPSLFLTSVSVLTFNPVSAGLNAAFATGQYFLGKKLSRNIEHSADIEGAYLTDVTSKQMEVSMRSYGRKHDTLGGVNSDSYLSTKKGVIETARMLLR